MSASHLTLAPGIARATLTLSGLAASLATSAGRRDIVSMAVHAVSPMAVPAPGMDTTYAAPSNLTSAAIYQLPFSLLVTSG